jgi:uncharacterized protein (TIGR03084 family)
MNMEPLLADLAAETRELDRMLVLLTDEQWHTPTPADGWTIADQVSHLAYFDEAATLSMTDAEASRSAAAPDVGDIDALTARVVAQNRGRSGAEVLAWFRDQHAVMVEVMRHVEPSMRVPWFGLEMSAASLLTARIMEIWAHGQDIADALEARRTPTPALRDVAHLGVWAFANSYRAHKLPVPEVDVRVALDGPSGEEWAWGPETAVNRVEGPALDFCLVVTQRRHVDDTALVARGDVAKEWMTIAQAFGGPPGAGRRAGFDRDAPQRSKTQENPIR